MEHRAALNKIYTEALPVEIQLSTAYQSWRFNIRVKDKERTLNAIFASGLFASSHYASLAGIMAGGHCDQAEILANEVINLFNDHFFNEQSAEQVCKIIRENLN